MTVFVQQYNPISGKNEWNPQKEDYDYKQEIARCAFADMLHDSERNEKYYQGLKVCVNLLRQQKKQIHVLDIGTGTGLLSMMALSLGVDSVTACETFTPMAECAQNIFTLNGYKDRVRLIKKRSTEMKVGPDEDMVRRANLLVTEVFDTELIGEGAIETFSHAKEHLLKPDAYVVPCKGTIYAQVVTSKLLRSWNTLSPVLHKESKQVLLNVPPDILACPGTNLVHDFQLSELSRESFEPLSNPIAVFEFDWTGSALPLVKDRLSTHSFSAIGSGSSDAVLMWWDITMDPLDQCLLSCAPYWEHPLTKGTNGANSSDIPWRDHWMQAVYFLPQSTSVKEGEEVSLISAHDEYSLWFSLEHSRRVLDRPHCVCGLHMLISRTRMGQLNDSRRLDFYVDLLEKNITVDSICLLLGNFPLIGLIAAKLGAKHVYLHEPNAESGRVLKKIIKYNQLENQITLLDSELSDVTLAQLAFTPANFVFGEPSFFTSMLPWHSLQFLNLVNSGRHLIAPDALILPSRMSIKAVPVQFRDLWKIRAPLGKCFGFDHSTFDEVIDNASEEADEIVEPQPLWEYPSKCLGKVETLLTVPLDEGVIKESIFKETSLEVLEGVLNGFALWVDWHFDQEVLTTGATETPVVGSDIVWDQFTRQGIVLLKSHIPKDSSQDVCVCPSVEFNPHSGAVNFDFKVSK